MWPKVENLQLIGESAASSTPQKERNSLKSTASSPSILEQVSAGLSKSLLPIDTSKFPQGVTLSLDELTTAKDGTPVAFITIKVKRAVNIDSLLAQLRASSALKSAGSFISLLGAVHRFSGREAMVVRAALRLASPKKLLATRTIVGTDKKDGAPLKGHKLVVVESLLQKGLANLEKENGGFSKGISYGVKIPTFWSRYIPIPTGYRKIRREGDVKLKRLSLRCCDGYLSYGGKVSGFVEVLTSSRGVEIKESPLQGYVYVQKGAKNNESSLKMDCSLRPHLDTGVPTLFLRMFKPALYPSVLALSIITQRMVAKVLRKKMAVRLPAAKVKPRVTSASWSRWNFSWGPVAADLTELLRKLGGVSFKGRVAGVEIKSGKIELELTSTK